MTVKEFLSQLASTYPDYWAWLQNKPNALDKVKALAREAADSGWKFNRFDNQVTALKSYTSFSSGQTQDDAPPLEEPTDDTTGETGDVVSPALGSTEAPSSNEDVRDLLAGFLSENELPSSLLAFITDALGQKKSYARIVAELRETPEYKTAYPEMELRQAAGFDRMSEAEIRAYRGEARRLATEYLGVNNLSNQEVATLIGKNKSLREWEHDLQTYRELERWGPAVKFTLAQELGYVPEDELVFRFLHADIATPDLDRAYSRALTRAQPAMLGLGIRPEEEARILEQYGISPEQAFKGYQGIVGEMPRSERLAAIDAEINRNIDRFPSPTQLFANTPFSTLFRAIQLGDQDAIRQLQASIGHEVARFQAGGGVAQSGSGAAVGLLTANERQGG